jgi:hypothetical protein
MRRFLRRLRRNLFRLVPIMTRMTHRPDLGDAARRHAVAAAPVGPRGDRRVRVAAGARPTDAARVPVSRLRPGENTPGLFLVDRRPRQCRSCTTDRRLESRRHSTQGESSHIISGRSSRRTSRLQVVACRRGGCAAARAQHQPQHDPDARVAAPVHPGAQSAESSRPGGSVRA